jgi:hypothetical protein
MAQMNQYCDETQETVSYRAYEIPCWRQGIAATGSSLAGRMANDRGYLLALQIYADEGEAR